MFDMKFFLWMEEPMDNPVVIPEMANELRVVYSRKRGDLLIPNIVWFPIISRAGETKHECSVS